VQTYECTRKKGTNGGLNMGKKSEELELGMFPAISAIGGMIGKVIGGETMFGKIEKREIAKGVIDMAFDQYDQVIKDLRQEKIDLMESLDKAEGTMMELTGRYGLLQKELSNMKDKLKELQKKKRKR
jgi:hypothetical protein